MVTAPAPSDRQLPEFPALVIDGSGPGFFVGLLESPKAWAASVSVEEPVLESLFPSTRRVFDEAGVAVSDVRSFVYCEGPGSVLGLRLCAMAVEVWRRLADRSARCFAFNRLALVATLLRNRDPDSASGLLIADWKKNAWHGRALDASPGDPHRCLGDADVAAWEGPVFHLPQRKSWQPPPNHARTVDHPPTDAIMLFREPELLSPTNRVQLRDVGANAFRKWTPHRHGPADAGNRERRH